MLNKKMISMLVAIIMIVLSIPFISYGLESRSELIPGLKTINDVAYGGNIYVQACNGGQIAYSKDMKAWKCVKISDSDVIGVKFIKDLFVALDKSDCIYISKDCVKWSKQKDFSGAGFHKMLTLNRAIFIVGKKGAIAKSTDGKTWTMNNSLNAVDIKDMVYNGKVYSVIGSNNGNGLPYVVIYYSKDLKKWKQAYHGKYYDNNVEWYNLGMNSDKNKLIAYYSESFGLKMGYGEDYYILTSTDGIKWVRVKNELHSFIQNISPFDSGYIVLCDQFVIGPTFSGLVPNVFFLDKNFKVKTSINTNSQRMKNISVINGSIFLFGEQGCFEVYKNFQDIKNSVDYKRILPDNISGFSNCEFDEKNSRYIFCKYDKIFAVGTNGTQEVLYEGKNLSLYKTEDRFVVIDTSFNAKEKEKTGFIKSIDNVDIYQSYFEYLNGKTVYDSLNKRLVTYVPGLKNSEGVNTFVFEFDRKTGEWKSIKAVIDSVKIGCDSYGDDIQIQVNQSDIRKFFTTGEFSYVNNRFFITTAYGNITSEDCVHWKINVSTDNTVSNNMLYRFGKPIAYDEKNKVYISLSQTSLEKSSNSTESVLIQGYLSGDALSLRSSIQTGISIAFRMDNPIYDSTLDNVRYVFLLKNKNLFITEYGNIYETNKNYFGGSPNTRFVGKRILHAYQSGDEVICLTEDFELLYLK